jgi:hypothetical protein
MGREQRLGARQPASGFTEEPGQLANKPGRPLPLHQHCLDFLGPLPGFTQVEDPLPAPASPPQFKIRSEKSPPAMAVICGNKALMLQRLQVFTRQAQLGQQRGNHHGVLPFDRAKCHKVFTRRAKRALTCKYRASNFPPESPSRPRAYRS